MVRAYCHRVIKLSSVLQSYAPEKEATSNVHGVRSEFSDIGMKRQQSSQQTQNSSNDISDTTTSNDNIIGTTAVGTTQVYFIGKLLWAKGLDIMLELEDYYKQCTGSYFSIDIYGNGADEKAITRAFHGSYWKKESGDKDTTTSIPTAAAVGSDGKDSSAFNIDVFGTTMAVSTGDSNSDTAIPEYNIKENNDSLPSLESLQVMAKEKIAKLKESINAVEIPKSFSEFRRQPIPATFPGRIDHAELSDYKIFVNPSISEVLCTTTAEALAMGKFAIIPDHPSNKFFLRFPNCLAYRNKFEFVANLRWALTYDPEPLTPDLARMFTWEAATDRFIEASAVTYREALERERLGRQKLDERIAWFHNELGKGETGDMLRKLLGAGPVSHQVQYQKSKQSSFENNGDESSKQGDDDGDDDDEGNDTDDDDGLSSKFRKSSFAKALRAALEDVGSMLQ
jgi:digalactosyldiacylglycerol synthase